MCEELSDATGIEKNELPKMWEVFCKSKTGLDVVSTPDSISRKDWVEGLV